MFSKEQLELLASEYSDQKISEMHNVSRSYVQLERSRLGVDSYNSRTLTLTFELLDELSSGCTDEEIAELLNMSASGVRKARMRLGVKAFGIKTSEAKSVDDYYALDELSDTYTNIEIAEIVGWTREYVNARCKELGVKSFTQKTGNIKTSDGRTISKFDHDSSIHIVSADNKRGKSQPAIRKHNFNESYFAEIDSEDKAYFLGWIISDGNVYKTTTSLSICDRDIVYTFAHCLNYPEENIEYREDDEIHQPQWRIRLNSIKMTQDLLELNITPNKSHTIQYPNIEPNLERHLIRGIWDGDGHVGKLYSYVTGSEPCLLGIKNALNSRGLPTADKLYEGVGHYRLRLLRSKRETLHWIYSNCSFYLPRKYNVVQEYW